MTMRSGAFRFKATELAVNNWAAGCALLRHHAQLLAGPDAPATLQYLIPPLAPVLQEMIDHLEVPDTSHWQNPADEWVIRSMTFHHRDAGWMARLVDLPTVTQAMLPEWQRRWCRSLAHWSGTILLHVGDASCMLKIDGTELRLVDSGSDETEVLQLTPALFTQVLFGYRSIASAIGQQGMPLREDVHTVLNVVFPTGHCLIPASDWF